MEIGYPSDPRLEMDGQKSQAKLTRNHSSLLRSLPTVRSSIHSLTSVAQKDLIKPELQQLQPQKQELDWKIGEEKRKPHRSGSTPRRTSSVRSGRRYMMWSSDLDSTLFAFLWQARTCHPFQIFYFFFHFPHALITVENCGPCLVPLWYSRIQRARSIWKSMFIVYLQ